MRTTPPATGILRTDLDKPRWWNSRFNRGCPVKTDRRNDVSANVSFVVEIDGKMKSEHEIFLDALKAGLELKRKLPFSRINVREAEKA